MITPEQKTGLKTLIKNESLAHVLDVLGELCYGIAADEGGLNARRNYRALQPMRDWMHAGSAIGEAAQVARRAGL